MCDQPMPTQNLDDHHHSQNHSNHNNGIEVIDLVDDEHEMKVEDNNHVHHNYSHSQSQRNNMHTHSSQSNANAAYIRPPDSDNDDEMYAEQQQLNMPYHNKHHQNQHDTEPLPSNLHSYSNYKQHDRDYHNYHSEMHDDHYQHDQQPENSNKFDNQLSMNEHTVPAASNIDDPQSNATGHAKWNCVMCTFENDSDRDRCIMCDGPSPLKNELWGKKICRTCNTVNAMELNHCQNCQSQLSGWVDYDENANLVLLEPKPKVEKPKKPKTSAITSPFSPYQNTHDASHSVYAVPSKQHLLLYSPYHDDVNTHYHYNPYDHDQLEDEPLFLDDPPYHAHSHAPPTNMHTYHAHSHPPNAHSSKKQSTAKSKTKKKKKKASMQDYVWGQSPFVPPASASSSSSSTMMAALLNSLAGGGGSFGGIDLFGAQQPVSQKQKKQEKENQIPRVDIKKEYQRAMQTGKTVRCRLIRRRQFVEDDEGDSHFRRCESQFMRSNQRSIQYNMMMAGGAYGAASKSQGMDGLNRTINEVEYVINPSLITRFERKKQALMDKYEYTDESQLNIVLAWHGTKRKNIDSIVENNFDLNRLSVNSGDTGWYGCGIYFSEYASISSGYGDGLLLCKVILGKSYRMSTAHKQTGRGLQAGFDSHLVVGDSHSQYGQEIVIFDVDQILPCYIIKY